MSKKLFLFGVIASVVTINSAFSVTSTVTSRDYVDAVVATKQPKIPATGTNAATPGDTVVTYTSTGDGTIGERGIYEGDRYFENMDGNKLVTADVVKRAADCIYENQQWMECTEWVPNAAHTDENCLLMTVREPDGSCEDPFIYTEGSGQSCTVGADCPGYPGNSCHPVDCFQGRCTTFTGVC